MRTMGQAFFNPADQQHIAVDATGWYRISYSIIFNNHDHAAFVRVFAANGQATDGYAAWNVDQLAGVGLGRYLPVCRSENFPDCPVGPVGIEPGNYGRFVMIRSGTNGTPSTAAWDSAGNAHIRSTSASAAAAGGREFQCGRRDGFAGDRADPTNSGMWMASI